MSEQQHREPKDVAREILLAASKQQQNWDKATQQAETPQQSEFEGHAIAPWTLSRYRYTQAVDVRDGRGQVIAEVSSLNKATQELIVAAPRLLRERDEARALLEETIIYVEECEQYHKPQCRTLSKRIKALLATTQGGAQ